MTEWEVVGVIIVLVGLIFSFVGPTIQLSKTITKLSVLIEGALSDMKDLKKKDEELQKNASESHRRLHERINDGESMLQNHEVRICNLEQKS